MKKYIVIYHATPEAMKPNENVSEEDMLAAVEFAHEQLTTICDAQEELIKKAGKDVIEYTLSSNDEQLVAEIKTRYFLR